MESIGEIISRRQFEAWVLTQYAGGSKSDKSAHIARRENGQYKSRSVRGEWLAWQASRHAFLNSLNLS